MEILSYTFLVNLASELMCYIDQTQHHVLL